MKTKATTTRKAVDRCLDDVIFAPLARRFDAVLVHRSVIRASSQRCASDGWVNGGGKTFYALGKGVGMERAMSRTLSKNKKSERGLFFPSPPFSRP